MLLALCLSALVCATAHADPRAAPCAAHRGTCAAQPSVGWEFAGPSTYCDRGDESGVCSAGAAQNVAAGADGAWFLGSVNGGLWRTANLQHAEPAWRNVIDNQPVTCSSISALHVSAADPRRVFAGCGGSTSSEQGTDWNVVNSGDWAGVMRSTDGGDTWRMLDGFPSNFYVTDILEPKPGHLLVSAQSHLYDRNDGGIWRSTDDGRTFERVIATPTFTLSDFRQGHSVILATHARSADHSVSVSRDGGATFADFGRLPWAEGANPFYTCATALGDGRIVVAGMTRFSDFPNATSSQFFVSASATPEGWDAWRKFEQPTSMDEDSMPKDRMALLADPKLRDVMYVAGNAGALAWRVNVTSGDWEKLWDSPEVTDGSEPHGDCRNYAWDHESDRLVLVSDGGVFARVAPRAPGGKWVSLNGDYASMELLSAHYDPRGDRYIAGAQDNSAQVTPINTTAKDKAIGFVGGDGTITLVDSRANPSRLYGTTQFLGVGSIDNDDDRRRRRLSERERDGDGDDDDDDCGGLCFVQGDKYINVPIDKHFPEPSSFPFFVQPYVLNAQDPTKLVFWTNGTAKRPSAFYRFDIPYSVRHADDIGAPTKVLESPEGAFFLDFVSGGRTAGKPDPELLLGVSNAHLYVRSSETGGKMVTRPLPAKFAVPVTMQYDPAQGGARIIGPVTHGRTISLSVSPSDSRVCAVTGWSRVDSNEGPESVYVTRDAGKTWVDATRNLKAASGVSGKVRPGGLLVVDRFAGAKQGERALLVGTSSGVLVSYLGASGSTSDWQRFGTCGEFPIVNTAFLSHEPQSDRIVAATFGRGIYVIKKASAALRDARSCVADY